MKKLENYTLIENTYPPDLRWDIMGLKPQLGLGLSFYQTGLNLVEKWLRLDSSSQMREQLFLQLFSRAVDTHNTSLLSVSFEPIKEILNDNHIATAWNMIITKLSQNNTYRNRAVVSSMIDNYNIPDMQYKYWKKSIVDKAIEKDEYSFLSLLYLEDKSIFKLRHLSEIFKTDETKFYFFKSITERTNLPDKLTPTVHQLIISGINHLDKNITSYIIFLNDYYKDQGISKIILSEIERLETVKKFSDELSILKRTILAHQVDLKIKIKNNNIKPIKI